MNIPIKNSCLALRRIFKEKDVPLEINYVFDVNKLLKDIENDYEISRDKEVALKEILKKIGYKNHAYCGKNMMEKRLGKSAFLFSLVSYSYTIGSGFSLDYSIGLKTKNESLRYITDKSGDTYYLCGLINYVLTNKETVIFEAILSWSKNQLQFSWKDNQFKEMIYFLINTDDKLSDRYSILENIVNDYLDEIECNKNLLMQNGKPFQEHSQDYSQLSVLYYLFKDYKNAIKMAEKALKIDTKYLENNDYRILQKQAYIDHLTNGTPLPYIPSPYDNISPLQLDGNDIYILLNKKSIKDTDILDYFWGIKNFDKPQKVNYKDMNNNDGITICKAGKWSILRIGTNLFLNYDQEKIESIVAELSDKYKRAILFINQDTSNTFGFEVYKNGELLRRWMAGDREVLENIGKPIIGEKKRFMDTLKKKQDSDSIIEFLDGVLKLIYGDLDKSKTVFYAVK